MGCICSKALEEEYNNHGGSKRAFSSRKHLSDIEIYRVDSLKMKEKIREKDRLKCGDVTVMLFDKQANGANDLIRKKTEIPRPCIRGIGRIPKATEAEQVAAGWPSWLATVAGEAIKDWLPKCAENFVKLDKIGQGTYSSVYKARDIAQDKVVALKRVRFDNHDTESIKFMAREILVLRRLDHPNIVKLEGLITSQACCSLYLVFEYMEHDLTGLASLPGSKFTEPQVKCYMKQLLSGLEHCHSHGVLHRDIKGSNLLIDNNGILKIADFGLAVFFDPQLTVPMTSRVVTLWYRPPELLLGASEYGAEVDLWSTGCILGELYGGKPILPGKTEVEQLHMIFKLCGSPSKDYWSKLHLKDSTAMKPPQSYEKCLSERFKDFPIAAMDLMDSLLSIDPSGRGTASSALNSEFFTASPFPCDPSSLPKYPPSKEIDSKTRIQEARGLKQSQRKQSHSGLKCHRQGDAASYSTDPHNEIRFPKGESKSSSQRVSNSGPLTHGQRWEKPRKELKRVPTVSSNYLTSFGSIEFETRKDMQERNGDSKPESISQVKNLPLKACTKEPALHQQGPKGNQIYVTGSFLLSSRNVNRMLKEHDHRIREYSRRARLENINAEKVQVLATKG